MSTPGPSTQLLSPAGGAWIALTILGSFLVSLSPFGRSFWFPDLLALTLVYWNVREARRMPLLVPFALGILTDVSVGNVLGQYALSYVILCWLGMKMQNRLPWLSYFGQFLHVLPVFLAARVLILAARLWAGGVFPGWEWFLPCLIDSLLWPLWGFLLQLPVRRAGRAQRPGDPLP